MAGVQPGGLWVDDESGGGGGGGVVVVVVVVFVVVVVGGRDEGDIVWCLRMRVGGAAGLRWCS